MGRSALPLAEQRVFDAWTWFSFIFSRAGCGNGIMMIHESTLNVEVGPVFQVPNYSLKYPLRAAGSRPLGLQDLGEEVPSHDRFG